MPGRRSQPQNGFQLDRTSPFYDGLTAITPNFGGAERVGSGNLLLGSEGWGFESPASANHWRVSPTSLASIHPTWTILTVLQGTLTSGSACQYVERPNGTQILKITGTSFGRPELVLRDAGGVGLLFLNSSVINTDVTSGAFRRVVAFTRRGTTDHRLYVNGVQEGVDTSTTVPFNFGATDAYIGHDDEDSGEFTAGLSFPLILVWNRSLTAEEMAVISENPWQVFEQTPDAPYLSALSGGVTANLSVTDATDTVSSTATVAISAALTRTDATDTLSSTATVAIAATLSRTDATDTLASTATAAISAALTRTDATDTLASTATVAIAVNLSATDATDTLASDAVLGAAGIIVDLAVTDATDTAASTATVAISAALSATDAADTLDSAVVTAGDITVTFAQTDATDTLQSQATLESDRMGHGGRNAGRMDFRQWDDVDMRERVARLSVTDADDTVQATAVVTYPERYVSANLFDGDDVAEAAAVVVPWPALELMREHRLERWFPKGRGPRALSEG